LYAETSDVVQTGTGGGNEEEVVEGHATIVWERENSYSRGNLVLSCVQELGIDPIYGCCTSTNEPQSKQVLFSRSTTQGSYIPGYQQHNPMASKLKAAILGVLEIVG
jgi:hypothetical protein